MKSELEKNFYERVKKILDEFYMTLYCMEPSKDAYHDLCELISYFKWTVVHHIRDETIDEVTAKLHKCSNELIVKFKAISDFMEDFYEENKDNPVDVIVEIGRWNRSIWIDMYSRLEIMAEFMKFRMKASGKDIE